MESHRYVSWACSCPDANIVEPPVTKQELGWELEKPAFEFFNWHMNRTDNRLSALECPYERVTKTEAAGHDEIAQGINYEVPEYYYDSGQLQVFLQGILCHPGEEYDELDPEGIGVSTYISWKQNIPSHMEVYISAPEKARAGVTGSYHWGTEYINIIDENAVVELNTNRQECIAITCSKNFILRGVAAPSGYVKKTIVFIQDTGVNHDDPYVCKIENTHMPAEYGNPTLSIKPANMYVLTVTHINGEILVGIEEQQRQSS